MHFLVLEASEYNGLTANDVISDVTDVGNGDTFTFKVYDGTAYSSSTYTMTINATAVNDAPTGGNDAVSK